MLEMLLTEGAGELAKDGLCFREGLVAIACKEVGIVAELEV